MAYNGRSIWLKIFFLNLTAAAQNPRLELEARYEKSQLISSNLSIQLA